MNYVKNYVAVIRYGRAPHADITALAEAGLKDGVYSANNNADAALADFLADHQDPREVIIRRDLEHRNDQNGWGGNFIKQEIGPDYTTHLYSKPSLPNKEGILEIRRLQGKNNKVLYRTVWRINKEGPEINHYIAYLRPEELKPIMDEFVPDHAPLE